MTEMRRKNPLKPLSQPIVAQDETAHAARRKQAIATVQSTAPAPPERPWNNNIQKRYARVIALIGNGAHAREDRKSQRELLEEAGREIETLTDFRRLCTAELRDRWFMDRDTKVRTVHHCVETWTSVYRYWYKYHGSPNDHPEVTISAVDRTGTYQVTPIPERRTSAARLWDTIENTSAKLNLPTELVAQFRRDGEIALIQACNAKAESSKVEPLAKSAHPAPSRLKK